MLKAKNLTGYSLALFSIANEENKVKEYLEDAKSLIFLFKDSDLISFIELLDSETLIVSEKDKIVNTTFVGLYENFLNFLKLLAAKKKFKYLKEILDIFVKQCCEKLKIKEGIIYSTELISLTKIKQIENKLSLKQNCKISLKNLIDKELISGIKIIIENQIIENSMLLELEEIKQVLKERI